MKDWELHCESFLCFAFTIISWLNAKNAIILIIGHKNKDVQSSTLENY